MKNFQIQYANKVLTVTISRPKALNALNAEVLEELNDIIQELYQNNDTRGLILTGDGDKAFVAGADIKELAVLDQSQALALAKTGLELFKKIENCPKPIIAAVNGYALGGGCELAMACHIRIATTNAKFGQPEVNLGIIPGYGGTQRLTQLVGRGKALELMLTGDPISADEAKSLGLVNHVVSGRDEMMTLATTIITKIVSKSPIAIENIIKTVNAGFGFEDAGYLAESQNFAACTTTNDFKEGTKSFVEKRQPSFTGR
jgi:enoyl-CoA hydratase